MMGAALLSTLPRGVALVVAPHADDEVLEAGGTMARLAALGWDVRVAFFTVAGYASLARGDSSSTALRADEARRALECLRCSMVGEPFAGNELHLRLDVAPQADLIGFVQRAIELLAPTFAVVPSAAHHHQDHRAAGQACVAALRAGTAASPRHVPVVLAYGHALAGWGGEAYAFRPNVFVDISDHFDRKLEALSCYKSQLCTPPHSRSLDSVRQRAAYWGAQAGVSYAEAFECLRWTL